MLNLRKCVFLIESVVFCDKKYRKEAVKYDQERMDTLMQTPVPKKAVNLNHFLNSFNWNRDSIPLYAQVTEPLYDLMEQIFKETDGTSNTKTFGQSVEWYTFNSIHIHENNY